MKTTLDYEAESFSIELIPRGAGRSYRVSVEDGTAWDVELLGARDGKLDLLIDGRRVTAYVSSDNNRRWVTIDGRTLLLTKSSGAHKVRGGHLHAAGELVAPMPGQVRAVNIQEGDLVTKGQTLLLLEAMKMEIRVQAARDGRVKKLHARQGQTVEREQILVEIEENSL